MRLILPYLLLGIFLSSSLQAKEHLAIEHTTIMNASCALQDKQDMKPGCKKNSDAFMTSWHSQAKPLLNALKEILSESKAQRLEVMLTVDHATGVKNITTSKAMNESGVKKVKAILAKMKFSLIKGNEFKLKVRSQKRKQ